MAYQRPKKVDRGHAAAAAKAAMRAYAKKRKAGEDEEYDEDMDSGMPEMKRLKRRYGKKKSY